MWIKLHRIDSGSPVMVNTDTICCYFEKRRTDNHYGHHSIIYFIGDDDNCIMVKESMDQIADLINITHVLEESDGDTR